MIGCCSFCGFWPKRGHAKWCARPKGVSSQLLWRRQQRARGCCVQCGVDAGGKSRCGDCDEKQKARREAKGK